ncbi:rhodanese-like domain-containing protein [Bizionia arctica]|uniref:Rhodanese n=1 Tax=Bizionia arctica TaxID=1495645 RepID=A0A917GSC8_9FLAO|nr:rhodanese-like domain-containing protein [Bizionia arctica]GGG54990.1 rhodanese [Bizionia arctica]
MADLNQEQWQEQLSKDDNALILDVRTEDEVAEGYIKKAKHIDIYLGQEFVEQIQALDKSKNYYVYCRSGGRSAQACAIMNELGFPNAYNLLGGFNEWQGTVENE